MHNDLSGNRYGQLTVLYMVKKGAGYAAHCRCDCGTEKIVQQVRLNNGQKSCGCQPRDWKPKDLTGETFGYLVVTSMSQCGKTSAGAKSGTFYAMCTCTNCGRTGHPVLPGSLRRGATKSCGQCRPEGLYLTNKGENNPNFRGYKEIRSAFWKGYVAKAREKELEFEITKEYAWRLFEEQSRKCVFSGIPLIFGSTRKLSLTTASIDRIDSSKGYVIGNIQWVHKMVNIMRNVLSPHEFIHICKLVAATCSDVNTDATTLRANPFIRGSGSSLP